VPGFLDARIVILDDQPASLQLLERLLRREGYTHVDATTDPAEALHWVETRRTDLVLLDLHMPVMDGFQALAAMGPVLKNGYLPVVVLTGDSEPRARQKALALGARDFISKPLDVTETLLRIGNLLETRRLHLELTRQKLGLEETVRERTAELERARADVFRRLTVAAEYRDDQTGEHTRRVGELSYRLAVRLGRAADEAEEIRRAATLHDIGKMGVGDAILGKPGPLTDEERLAMQEHTRIGHRILSGSRVPLLQCAAEIALSHHEHWDGTGYPAGLAGDAIPFAARVVAVADAVDAMLCSRCYRTRLTRDFALAELERQAGAQFDARVAAAAIELIGGGAADDLLG
jgi:putative two-component system response regulator